jgi:hypothetical protein
MGQSRQPFFSLEGEESFARRPAPRGALRAAKVHRHALGSSSRGEVNSSGTPQAGHSVVKEKVQGKRRTRKGLPAVVGT